MSYFCVNARFMRLESAIVAIFTNVIEGVKQGVSQVLQLIPSFGGVPGSTTDYIIFSGCSAACKSLEIANPIFERITHLCCVLEI